MHFQLIHILIYTGRYRHRHRLDIDMDKLRSVNHLSSFPFISLPTYYFDLPSVTYPMSKLGQHPSTDGRFQRWSMTLPWTPYLTMRLVKFWKQLTLLFTYRERADHYLNLAVTVADSKRQISWIPPRPFPHAVYQHQCLYLKEERRKRTLHCYLVCYHSHMWLHNGSSPVWILSDYSNTWQISRLPTPLEKLGKYLLPKGFSWAHLPTYLNASYANHI